MTARGSMTMRAQVERSAAGEDDPWGRPGPPAFVSTAEVPCRAWSKTRREFRDDGKTAVVEDMRAIVPSGADVQEGDRLTITNRLGAVLFDGPVAVDTISRRGAAQSAGSHLELMLVRHA